MNQMAPDKARAEFDALLLEMQRQLLNWATLRLGCRDRAQDLVQQANEKMLAYRHSFTGGNFRAWAFCVLRNEITDHYRRQRVCQHVPIEMLAEHVLTDPDNPEATTAARQIIDMIEALREPHRDILRRICIRGAGYEETAADLGLSVGTIKSRLWRARAMIQQQLQEAGVVA